MHKKVKLYFFSHTQNTPQWQSWLPLKLPHGVLISQFRLWAVWDMYQERAFILSYRTSSNRTYIFKMQLRFSAIFHVYIFHYNSPKNSSYFDKCENLVYQTCPPSDTTAMRESLKSTKALVKSSVLSLPAMYSKSTHKLKPLYFSAFLSKNGFFWKCQT